MEQSGLADYIPLLMQVYYKRPAGIKAMYSRQMVALSLELHVPPQTLHEQLFALRRSARKSIQRLWQRYDGSARLLASDCRKLRAMRGYGNAAAFYEGVDCHADFEQAFMPLNEDALLMPITLVIILNVYFQLTPITMTADTPEVITLARQLKLQPRLIADVMTAFQQCDPFLDRKAQEPHRLLEPCKHVWQRYACANPSELAATAAQLVDYFKG